MRREEEIETSMREQEEEGWENREGGRECVCVWERERESEREKERESARERETETETETKRQRQRQRGIEMKQIWYLTHWTAVSDLIRTSLGPRGMDKMIQSGNGDTEITNDGATIMSHLEVNHPAARMASLSSSSSSSCTMVYSRDTRMLWMMS